MKAFVLILAVFLVAGCTSPQKLLQQTWKIDDIVFIDSLNTFTADQKKNMLTELRSSFSIHFLADSIYTATNQNKTLEGRWWVDKRRKILYTKNHKDGLVVSKIYELDKTHLKFETSNQEYLTFIYSCSPKVATK